MAENCRSLPVPRVGFDLDAERDACGIGFVAHVDGVPRRSIVAMALQGLAGVKHRGAVAADARSGDGAGILTQIPRDLAAVWGRELSGRGVDPARTGLAMLFLESGTSAAGEAARRAAQQGFE